MPCWTAPDRPAAFLGTKVVTVFPGNAARGLPSVAGLYVLMDGATGRSARDADGARLTLWRTAAASALASRSMARPQARRLLMVGAGALAGFLRARMRRSGRSRASRSGTALRRAPERVAAALRAEGREAAAVTDLEAAARQADIVSLRDTLSATPLVKGAWLKEGRASRPRRAFNMRMREGGRRGAQPRRRRDRHQGRPDRRRRRRRRDRGPEPRTRAGRRDPGGSGRRPGDRSAARAASPCSSRSGRRWRTSPRPCWSGGGRAGDAPEIVTGARKRARAIRRKYVTLRMREDGPPGGSMRSPPPAWRRAASLAQGERHVGCVPPRARTP